MSAPTFKAIDMINYFFEDVGSDVWKCKNTNCMKDIKQNRKSGYTNLKNHLQTCIGPNYKSIYQDMLKSSSSSSNLHSFGFINNRQNDVYLILKWIIFYNQPLVEVDQQETRDVLKAQSISSKSIRKYILSLTELVEEAIKPELPDTFALEFDGWSSGTVHYVALIASYKNNSTRKEVLLALVPLIDEESLGAKQHIEFMAETLHLYGKSLSNIVALVGDNCSTNCKISNDTGIPLIGCASHRFNLAVNHWIDTNAPYGDALSTVHELMTKLQTLKNAARLCDLTDLCAVKPNETRWSGKYEMVARYFRIADEVQMIL